jgi:hypothetical protein
MPRGIYELTPEWMGVGSDPKWGKFPTVTYRHVHHPSLLRKRDMTPASDNLKTGEVAALPAAIEV